MPERVHPSLDSGGGDKGAREPAASATRPDAARASGGGQAAPNGNGMTSPATAAASAVLAVFLPTVIAA